MVSEADAEKHHGREFLLLAAGVLAEAAALKFGIGPLVWFGAALLWLALHQYSRNWQPKARQPSRIFAAVALLIGAAFVTWALGTKEPPPPPLLDACSGISSHTNRGPRLLQPPPDLMIYYDSPSIPVLSPDGGYVAALASKRDGGSRLLITPSDRSEWHECVQEPQSSAWWSQDSTFLFYVASSDGVRRVMRIDTGCKNAEPLMTVPTPGGFAGASANASRYMLISVGGSIYYGHEADEKPDVLLRPERGAGEWLLTNPSFGPDGDRFLYTVLATDQKDDAVYEASVTRLLKEQSPHRRGRRLFPAETHAEFMTPTCLIFVHKGWLLAQPYDAASDQPTSKPPIPLRIASRIGRAEWTHRGAFSVAAGRIAYFNESSTPVSLVEFSGDESEPRTLEAMPGTQNPEVSPDGRRVVFEVRTFIGQNRNLYSIDRAGDNPKPLTSDSGDNADPVWSRSGEILFSSNRTRPRSLYLLKLGAPLGSEQLVGAPEGSRGVTPNSRASDGRLLVGGTIDDYSGLFLLDSPSAKEPSLRIRDAGAGQFSPGRGDWIAYHARNRYGHLEVFVTRSDGSTVGAPRSVSRGKGCRPRWASDGRQVFFVTDTGPSGGDRLLMAASFDDRTGLIGRPRLRSRHRLLGPLSRGNYAFWPDMDPLMVINAHDPDPPHHEIVDLR